MIKITGKRAGTMPGELERESEKTKESEKVLVPVGRIKAESKVEQEIREEPRLNEQ